MIIVNKNKAPIGWQKEVINMEYNCYSIKTLNKFLAIAKSFRGKGLDSYQILKELEKLGYTSFSDVNTITILIDSEVETIEEKVFYRIGEPLIDTYGNFYKPSWNFADDRPEIGVSVVTMDWLNSLKSVFFGAHNAEKLKARGIYEIKGVIMGFGGDDEPLIYPTGWAKKTKIRSLNGLIKALKAVD